MMNDYERRSLRLMRAYPRRYRDLREDEILGTLLDCAAPEAARPSLRDTWDVIRSGLMVRLRDRPPVHRWLAYRIAGARLPHRYRLWVRDDALGRFFFLRHNLGNQIFGSFFMLTVPVVMAWYDGRPLFSYGPSADFLPILAGIIGVFLLLPARGSRRVLLRKYGFDEDGTPLERGEA